MFQVFSFKREDVIFLFKSLCFPASHGIRSPRLCASAVKVCGSKS